MPDLETLLRDVRPVPDPRWAARLDARVAAGFPGRPSRLKRVRMTFRAHFLALGAVGAVASVFILMIVGLSSMDMSGDEEGSSGAGGAEPATMEDHSGNGAGSAAPERRPATPGDNRAVLRNASVTLSARPDQVEGIADQAIRIVDTLGGYVENSEVSRDGGNARATLTLKLPTRDLDKGLAQISALAHVSSRSQQAQDVSDQRERLEALVRDARADRDGLRARLARADSESERARLRELLDRASRRVSSRQTRLNQLGREVSYATVALTVEGDRDEGGAAASGERWTPGDALDDAGRMLEVIAGVLVIVLAIVLPVAILVALGAFGGRLLRRRRRERALGSV